MICLPRLIRYRSGTNTVGAVNQGTGGTSPWEVDVENSVPADGVYNSTPPTLSSGQTGELQLNSSGQLLVNCTGCSSSSTVTANQGTGGTSPWKVQQASSVNTPANPNEFYFTGYISSVISGINACITPTSGNTFYITQVSIQDIQTNSTTSYIEIGNFTGVTGGTVSSTGSLAAVNTTLNTLTPPTITIYSAAPSGTNVSNFAVLLSSGLNTMHEIYFTGNAELPLGSAVSSAGQEICLNSDTAGFIEYFIEGYEP